MPSSVKELTKERQLILLCSRGVLKEEHIANIKEILSDRVDWRDILYQGITHRTLNLMYYHLKNLGLTDKIEKEVLKVMENESKVYALRNRTFYAAIKDMFDRLNDNNIRVAIIKGNFLSSKVYPSIETRTFSDVDFLLDIRDGQKIVKVLEDLGYIQGGYNYQTAEIIPYNRKQKLHHQMTTHELAPCFKKTDNPFVPMILVDLNYSILWKGNCPCEIDTAELLERAYQVDIDGAKIYVLGHEDFLVQLACHLYKEAALMNWIEVLADLKLYKFADIVLYIEKFSQDIKWDKLVSFCERTGCSKIVYYPFHYVNLMYGEIIPQAVMDALEPENKDYLDEYGIENEKPCKWQFDFLTRMFETNRLSEISEELLAKKNSFWETESKFGQN
jgi:hypothetical protein